MLISFLKNLYKHFKQPRSFHNLYYCSADETKINPDHFIFSSSMFYSILKATVKESISFCTEGFSVATYTKTEPSTQKCLSKSIFTDEQKKWIIKSAAWDHKKRAISISCKSNERKSKVPSKHIHFFLTVETPEEITSVFSDLPIVWKRN